MSTTRCKHGNVTSDTMGSYVCTECDPASRIEELEAEVERLRSLVKLAEFNDRWRDDYHCPWCGVMQTRAPMHAADCPAFTPGGEVR